MSTVPLTNGTIAAVWGVRHMSMLGGVVFLIHQLGSFAGGWLGGWLYDHTGTYDGAWAIAIGLSVIAAVLNWPIRETPTAERDTGRADMLGGAHGSAAASSRMPEFVTLAGIGLVVVSVVLLLQGG